MPGDARDTSKSSPGNYWGIIGGPRRKFIKIGVKMKATQNQRFHCLCRLKSVSDEYGGGGDSGCGGGRGGCRGGLGSFVIALHCDHSRRRLDVAYKTASMIVHLASTDIHDCRLRS